MNAAMYQNFLQSIMLPSACRIIGRQFIFQHVNNPKHMAKSTGILEENQGASSGMAFAISR
ncbi:UNVERIFIED_CONTAM: hypothetical protein FKN15_032349 [Acipenser sinensis]